MTDRIRIDGLRLLLHVGVPEAEREHAQPIRIDLDLGADLRAAGASDAVEDTVDYGAVADAVAAALVGPPVALLETVASRAADAVLADASVHDVVVRVTKLRPPVPHHVESTSVQIHRHRP